MNILVLSWRDSRHPQAGGAEQVMHEHMKGWIKDGHGITILSSRFPGSQKKEVVDGIKTIHMGDQYVGTKMAAFFFWIKYHQNFDLVVDQFHGIPFFTPLYVRKPKLAVLQEVAKEVWFLSGLTWPINWILGLTGYLLEPLFFLFYKKIQFMVGSQSAKDDLIKMGISQDYISIVPHGVILKKSKKIFKKEKRTTIIFLGALTKDKGVEDAIQAFSLLDKIGAFNFWIVGRGTEYYQKKLLDMSKKIIKKSKLVFWGYVNENKKFELLARAHVLINPSIREGWGLVNIEANALGTPVVSYKSAGLIDSVKENVSGVFCKQNVPDELAREIINLTNDKKKYSILSKGSLSWSKEFSWENSRKKSLTLLKQTLENKH